MKNTQRWLCTILFFLFSLHLQAASRYWVGLLPGNWSSTLNWSASSGGLGGSSVPAAADNVFFDGGAGPDIGNCTIDVAVSITSITVSAGYSGTISQGANTIAVSGAASFGGGTFTGGSANITVTGVFTLSATAFTSTSATLELDNNTAFTGGTFSHNNGTVLYNGLVGQTISGTSPVFYTLQFVGNGNTYSITSTGDITVMNALNFTGSQLFNLNTAIIDVLGDINSSNTNTGCGGSAQINIDGAGTQNFNGNATTAGVGALPQLTINKASGTLNLSGFPAVANNFTYSTGTVSPGTSTFCFARGPVNSYSITGSVTLNNISFALTNTVTATIAAGTTLTATGNLTYAGTGGVILNTGNINVNGNILLTNTSAGGGGTATINIVGTGAQTMDGTAITVNESRLPNINIDNPGGTLNLAGNISFSANVTYTAGTINPGTAVCYVVNNLTMTGNFSLYNLTVLAAGNTTLTIAAGSTVTTTNTLDLENGANRVSINTGTIAVQGSLIDNNTNTTGGGTGTLLFNGAGAQTITSTGVINQGKLPAVTINDPGGTVTLPSLISVMGNWTYTAGTVNTTTNAATVVFAGNAPTISSSGMSFYNLNFTTNTTTLASSLSVNNNLSITGTAILAPGANTINLGGNWSAWGSGAFTSATSTVNFNGSALQTITSTGGATFTNLTANNSSTGIQLENNATVTTTLTMTQGNIDLNGGNTLTLGTAVATNGTLAYTSGVIINTGSFTRWLKAATISTGSVNGLFPMGTTLTTKLLYLSAPTTAPTTGGTATVAYNDAPGSTLVTFADGASTVAVIDNLNWALSTGNGLAGGTYNLEAQGTGFGTIGAVADLRLTLAGSTVGTAGVNAGTPADPQVNTTGLTLANLSNTFYLGSVNYPSSPLPVQLISFTATISGGQVKLNWETAMETNNDYFIIQRSKDGTWWDSLTRVAGSGTSNTTTLYTAYDPAPYRGISYYRLIQTDLNGNQTYSPVCSVNLQPSSNNITITPNPATNTLLISFPAPGQYTVSLLNNLGQLMTDRVTTTASNITLNVSHLTPGVYYVVIAQGNTRETREVLIK